MAKSSILGYPRIGKHRELKKAVEGFWSGKIDEAELAQTAREIRHAAWRTQAEAGIDLIPCNDFSYYDQVLDTICLTGLVPSRFGDPRRDRRVTHLFRDGAWQRRGARSRTHQMVRHQLPLSRA